MDEEKKRLVVIDQRREFKHILIVCGVRIPMAPRPLWGGEVRKLAAKIVAERRLEREAG